MMIYDKSVLESQVVAINGRGIIIDDSICVGKIDNYLFRPISLSDLLTLESTSQNYYSVKEGLTQAFWYYQKIETDNQLDRRSIFQFEKVTRRYNLNDFGFSTENSAVKNTNIFDFFQDSIDDHSIVSLNPGTYKVTKMEIRKAGVYLFDDVIFESSYGSSSVAEMEGVLTISPSAISIRIHGLSLRYTGVFYYQKSDWFSGQPGQPMIGIYIKNRWTELFNCKANSFSHSGISGHFTSDILTLVNCECINNGYSGANSSGKNFIVLGGVFNENGGANTVGDGYGIFGNVGTKGSFKVIAATAVKNRTRNIDSHMGQDLVIANNLVEDAGKAHSQWGNTVAADGNNLQLVRHINRALICGNVSRRAESYGLMVSSSDSYFEIDNIWVLGNIFEDDHIGIGIRQKDSGKIDISNNRYIMTKKSTSSANALVVDPQGAQNLKAISIIDNVFDGKIAIELNPKDFDYTASVVMTKNRVMDVRASSSGSAYIRISDNDIKGGGVNISFRKYDDRSFCEVNKNRVDSFAFKSSSSMSISVVNTSAVIEDNVIRNAVAVFKVNANQSFNRNVIINANRLKTNETIIYSNSSEPYSIIGNAIDSVFVAPLYYLRLYLAKDCVIKDNKFPAKANAIRIDYPGFSEGYKLGNKINWDSKSRMFDFGFKTPPKIDGWAWQCGDKAINDSPQFGLFNLWIYCGEWVGQDVLGLTFEGYGDPENSVSAPLGAIYHRLDCAFHNFFYLKVSGDDRGGWVLR
jgi:hypothetical protein